MEKGPEGTIETIAFLRQNIDMKQEEKGRRVGSVKSGKDTDEQSEESKHWILEERPSIIRRRWRDKRRHEKMERRSRRAAPDRSEDVRQWQISNLELDNLPHPQRGFFLHKA
ncbi:hypothetical protein NDU88_001815 [Pleurodeles waltl]|uniref:Uncharacterized protein n=1 Tax=Pleurodeles waltl TaxID=8319 RepID=A0AAV7WJG7_PLEWA|nr:hypothetical protein NDU88_001815 [Pleurodeles waltl]